MKYIVYHRKSHPSISEEYEETNMFEHIYELIDHLEYLKKHGYDNNVKIFTL